jgi:hypothetical protein
MIERIKHTSGLLVVILLVAGFYVFSLGVIAYADDHYISTQVTVNSAAPTVTSVQLNAGVSPITLTEGTTQVVTCSGTVTDQNGYGDVTTVTSSIYRSAIGAGCAANDNNCYELAQGSDCVTSSAAGNSMHVICTANIWFHADPTDSSSSPFNAQTWACTIRAIDNAVNVSDGASGNTPEMATLVAHDDAASINYGTLAPNTTASGPMVTTTITATGNSPTNVNYIGSGMTSGIHVIGAGNQRFATSTMAWGSAVVLQTTTPYTLLTGQTTKPTTHPSLITTDVGWGVDIPNGQAPGTYTGTNTSTSVAPPFPV